MSDDKTKLVDLWIHHNAFFWQQVRALPFVEAVILAGAYKLYVDSHRPLATAVLLFGTLLLLLIGLMLRRHAQHLKTFRDAAGDAIPQPKEPPLFCLRSDLIAKLLPVLLAGFNAVLFVMVYCGT